MARVLKADLEKEIQELKNELQELKSEVQKLKNENETLKFSLEKSEMSYKLAIEQSDIFADKCEKYSKEIRKLKNELPVKKHNERNAGRHALKLTKEEIARAQMLRIQGKTYKQIAEDIGYSVGSIHKILNQ